MNELLSFSLVALSAVFFVVDPLGVVPIFLAVTAGDSPQKMRSTALRASLTAFALLVFFALFGTLLFKVAGISLGAFRVAGGILLLVTGLDMLRARPTELKTSPEEEAEATEKEDVAIVPLAVPLLAGPGSIATVMVLMSRGKGLVAAVPVLLAVTVTCVASYLILRAASLVLRVLGQSGVSILQRVMGLILAAIAVQFMAEGVRELFNLPGA
jgi:multiple antibiotic resistance protein